MSDLPEPLTAPDCDLRGMPFMPVDIVRLFDSDLYALSTGDEFKAAFSLWGKAFLQVPAGSLPSDERILAHLSGAGAGWRKVRDMALHGWIKCSDGRLYHPVVSEKANEAWGSRQTYRERMERARAAKAQKRSTVNGSDETADATGATTQPETAPITDSMIDAYTGLKGQGQGQGLRKEDSSEGSLRSPSARSGGLFDDGPPPAAASPPEQAAGPIDAKTALFRDGLAALRRLTGKPDGPARALLGKLLRAAGDDCAGLHEAIRRAEDARPAAPIPWLTRAAENIRSDSKPASNGHRPPTLNDRPDAWFGYSPKREVAEKDGREHAVVNGIFLDLAANDIGEAARLRPDRPYDWDTLIGWLNAIPIVSSAFDGEVLPTIRRLASRPDYEPPSSLRYFDRAIRDRLGAA